MNWVKIDKQTKAAEVPGAGCIIKVGNALCFAPRVCIQNGKLVSAQTCETIITWSGGNFTGTSSKGWVRDAGEKLDKKLKAMNVTDALNKFIQQTWKITPTVKQLAAMRELLDR